MGILDVGPPQVRTVDEVDEVESVDVDEAAFYECPPFLHQTLSVVTNLEQYQAEAVTGNRHGSL